jgi:DNA polymerase-1
VVGEAPGHQEARHGKPFVGPSGQLLDQVLTHHGINRQSVYVDNVVACRPPDNRTPTSTEIRACWPRAKAEIQRRNPSTIVALGNTAGQTITGLSTGITSLRVGPPRRVDAFPDAKVITTVHPAFCLRSGDAFPFFVNDIGKINGSQKPWNPPRWTAVEEPADAIKVIRELQERYREIVVDIECAIEKDSAFDHPDHYQMLCIGFAYADGKAVVIGKEALRDPSVQNALRILFRDGGKRWIAHNGKFDTAALKSWGLDDNLYFDTMLASYCLDERPGTNSLGYAAVEELGAPDWKGVVDQYIGKEKNYALIPKKVLYEYNAYDCANTWDLWKYYTPKLEAENLRPLHDFLTRASMGLKYAEMAGVGVDESVLDELTDEYMGTLGGLEKQLGHWITNARSPKQVKEVLHNMGLKVVDTTEDTLTRLRERIEPESEEDNFLRLLLEHRKATKFYGTYVKGIRKRIRQGMVHTSFLVHGTTTGRLSSRNPNLQNIPRGPRIRRMFVPAPGNVFVQADYGQIELRVAAVLSGDPYLQGVFNDTSRDLFDELGVELHGPSALGPNRKEIRIKTKAYVYGVGYGRSAYDIARDFRIPEREAQQGIDTYFRLASRLDEWRRELMNQILDDNAPDLTTVFGRKRRFWLITRDNQQDVLKQGLAFIPQSTASDINLLAATRLRLDYGLDVRILVHDSTLVECAEGEAEEVSELMCSVMSATATEIMGDSMPFIVEPEIGTNWGFV